MCLSVKLPKQGISAFIWRNMSKLTQPYENVNRCVLLGPKEQHRKFCCRRFRSQGCIYYNVTNAWWESAQIVVFVLIFECSVKIVWCPKAVILFFPPVCGPICSLSIVLLECLWIFFCSSGAKFSVRPDDEASVADEELKVAWYLRQQRSGRLMLSSIQWTVMGCCQNDSLSGCHSELGSVKAQRVAAAAAAIYYIIIKHNATEIVTCVAKSKQILNYFVEQQSVLFSSLFFNTWSLWRGQEFACLFFFFF